MRCGSRRYAPDARRQVSDCSWLGASRSFRTRLRPSVWTSPARGGTWSGLALARFGWRRSSCGSHGSGASVTRNGRSARLLPSAGPHGAAVGVATASRAKQLHGPGKAECRWQAKPVASRAAPRVTALHGSDSAWRSEERAPSWGSIRRIWTSASPQFVEEMLTARRVTPWGHLASIVTCLRVPVNSNGGAGRAPGA